MSYERSKAPLALMEQIIMVLVFALAAAICLQAYVYANSMSKNGDWLGTATKKAQILAEYCKEEKGDLSALSARFSAMRKGDSISYEDEENHMVLSFSITENGAYLGKGTILVKDQEEKRTYTLDVAWQNGGKNE